MKYDYIPACDVKMIHIENSYTFGIDSILLSHFAKMKPNAVIADIGAGNGILSLHCNKLYKPQKIYAFEIQDEKAQLMRKNIMINDFTNIEVINEDVNKLTNYFKNNYLDYIITNPPYYTIRDNINSKDREFLISRQELYLNVKQILKFSEKKLKEKGRLYMIHKPERLVDIMKYDGKLKLKHIRFVHSHAKKKPKLMLLEFVKNAKDGLKISDPIIIYEDGNYSKEVLNIYGL